MMKSPENPRRLAVWSGPRNLSTALMRSFSSRQDTAVSDEPFYAAYLQRIEELHPGREEILSSQSKDWREVAYQLSEGEPPSPCEVWMQKQMSKHMLPEMLGDWLLKLEHVFLLRHPGWVITSYRKVIPDMRIEDTGLPWQTILFQYLLANSGRVPPVIRAEDLRMNPEGTLRALCRALDLEWDSGMLSWPAGPHPSDGVWGPHWYANTWKTTGFDLNVTPEDLPTVPTVNFYAQALEMHEHLESFVISPLTEF